MIFKYIFSRIWLVIDVILFILACASVTYGFFLWTKMAGFICLGLCLAIMGVLTEIPSAKKGG